ncbi:unnamed protein product [Hermetia illucens]|uniref:Cytochrome b5 heme-binding domain-containing protein n=1 Tax=Hermetia illucens TaxID=343691 RepID=A0A7R8ULX7_HERIL|nr:cytochrome b5 [Hermetia illucens]CAD7083108.1 unnamed protein product [Hermetia illucens]
MALPTYTLKDIAYNNGVDKPTVWIIISNQVYDVTKFIDEHPGGRELIMEHAGSDATKDFKSAGHSGSAYKDLKKYLIGELAEEDRIEPNGAAKVVVDTSEPIPRKGIFCCC